MTVTGIVGQTDLIPLWIQFQDRNGHKVDPTAGPTVEVYGLVGGVMSPPPKATPIPGKFNNKTGLYMASLDVTNVTTFPAGTYKVLWEATVDAQLVAVPDTLKLYATADYTAASTPTTAYTTEAEIRGVTGMLKNATQKGFPPSEVANKAGKAADYINGRLAVRYPVPFALPAPGIIRVLNDWKAAAMLLDWKSSERGDDHTFAEELHERVDAILDDIASGETSIGLEPLSDAGVSRIKSSTVDQPHDFVQRVARRGHSTNLSRF